MMSLGFAPRYDYFLGFIMFLAKVTLQTFLIFSLDLKQVSPNSIITWPRSSTRGSSFKGILTKIYQNLMGILPVPEISSGPLTVHVQRKQNAQKLRKFRPLRPFLGT